MIFSSVQYNFFNRPTRIFYIRVYKNFPWSTPVTEYRESNGMMLPSFASTIYHRPDGDFCYGEFAVKDIKYNCKDLI